MGANYILMYGRLRNADRVNERATKALPPIAAAIRDKEKRACGKLSPIYTWGAERARRKVHEAAHEYVVSDACTSCGLCRDICPVRNIEIADGRPIFGEQCEQCMACIQWCPQKAIHSGKKTTKRNRYRHPSITAADLRRG
jgi:flavoprotein